MTEHSSTTRNRREFLTDAFCGFGSLAFASMLQAEEARATRSRRSRRTTAKAKSVIFLFMAGGPSHLETFDPKPLLNKLDGQPRPAEFGEAKYQFITGDAEAARHEADLPASTARAASRSPTCFPHTRECVDDLAVIRSCHGDMVVHSAAQYELFTGRIVPGFPSMGSWVSTGWDGERVAARPTSSCPIRRARSKRASRCTPTASCRPCISRRCSAPARSPC